MSMTQQPDTRPPTPAQGAVLTERSGALAWRRAGIKSRQKGRREARTHVLSLSFSPRNTDILVLLIAQSDTVLAVFSPQLVHEGF